MSLLSKHSFLQFWLPAAISTKLKVSCVYCVSSSHQTSSETRIYNPLLKMSKKVSAHFIASRSSWLIQVCVIFKSHIWPKGNYFCHKYAGAIKFSLDRVQNLLPCQLRKDILRQTAYFSPQTQRFNDITVLSLSPWLMFKWPAFFSSNFRPVMKRKHE